MNSHRSLFEPLESRHLLSATVIEVTTTQDLVDPNDAFISLREAVLMANASPEDNEIVLGAGTYTLTRQGANEDGGLTGDLDVVANGKLRIVGAGASETTIDASGLYVPALFSGDRILEVAAQADVAIEGIGFTGGSTPTSGSILASAGGAIRTLGKLHVSDAIFSANTAQRYGGGIYAGGAASVSIVGSQFMANGAEHGGGGLAVDGSAVVNVETSVFEGNTSLQGGALYARSGSLFVHESQLRANRASTNGGGVYVRGAVDFALVDSVVADSFQGGVEVHSSRPVSIRATTISGNEGGGITQNGSGTLTIANSTISANHTSRTGGVHVKGPTLILNSTITLNRSASPEFPGAGGIDVSIDGTLTMHNTLVAGNLAGTALENVSRDITLNGGSIAPESSFNFIGNPNSAGGFVHGTLGNLVGDGQGGLIDIHQVLNTVLADNGGPTPTHALVEGSPAVNAGDPAFEPTDYEPSLEFDQRGTGYPRVLATRVDIGAYEGEVESPVGGGTINVDTFDDVVADDGMWSLREAILYANSRHGDVEIILQPGIYHLTRVGSGENAALTGDLDVVGFDAIRIIGQGAAATSIDASGLFDEELGYGDRIFDVLAGATLEIEGVTLTGGAVASGQTQMDRSGGAIRSYGGRLHVLESVIQNNSAVHYGGGIYASGDGQFAIRDSQVIQNTSQHSGGGLYADSNGDPSLIERVHLSGNTARLDGGGAALSGFAIVRQSVFEANTAQQGGGLTHVTGISFIVDSRIEENFAGSGGGIKNRGTLTLISSSVTDNTAGGQGGAIYQNGGDLELINSTVAGNRTNWNEGGALYLYHGDVKLSGTTISDNHAAKDGGAMFMAGSFTLEINNSTLSGNTARANGGAIYASSTFGGTIELNHATVTGNRSASQDPGQGGGLFLGSLVTTTLQNSIVAGNLRGAAPTGTPDDIALGGGQLTGSYNLIGDPGSSGGLANGANGNLVGDGFGGVVDINTVLDTTLADNDGQTRTHALLSTSPAVNAGNPTLDTSSLPFDQRGAGFTRVHGGRADIGSFEFGSSFVNVLAGRHVFYNNSQYDWDASINEYDRDAIDPSKQALLPDGSLATAANVTGYSRGINGVMVDLAGSHPNVTAADFIFRVGATNDPGSWAIAPAPAAIQVLARQGVGGADRVVITWPDGAIKNTYLQVIVAANENTGLAEPDTFFFGNRVGDSFSTQPPASFVTSAADELAARNALQNQDVSNPFDYDKNRFIGAADMLIARNNPGVLPRIQIAPPAAPLAAASNESAGDVRHAVEGISFDGNAIASALGQPGTRQEALPMANSTAPAAQQPPIAQQLADQAVLLLVGEPSDSLANASDDDVSAAASGELDDLLLELALS